MWLTQERRFKCRHASLAPLDTESCWTNEHVLITMKKVPHFQPASEGNWIQDTKGISYQPLRPIHIHPSLLQLPSPGFLRRGLKCAVHVQDRGTVFQNTAWHSLPSFHTFCILVLNNPCAFTLHMSRSCLNHEDILKRLEILFCFWCPTPTVITHQWLFKRNL